MDDFNFGEIGTMQWIELSTGKKGEFPRIKNSEKDFYSFLLYFFLKSLYLG